MRLVIFFIFFFAIRLFPLLAQDHQAELKIPGSATPIEFIADEGGGFFVICEGKLPLSNVPNNKSVYKLDSTLKPVWKKPQVFKTFIGAGVYSEEVNALSYTNPADGSTVDYLAEGRNFYQVLPDGILREIDTKIPKKEADRKAALFTDADGFHVLTLAGDETFPTGVIQWYTFSHRDLTPTRKKIVLPLPTAIDEDNESGWRLNAVTNSGLYFYYVSYKNEVKDNTRPVLSAKVVHVDKSGKAGQIVELDPDVDTYTVFSAGFRQDKLPGVNVEEPQLFERDFNGNTWRYLPTDNAYMGIKIDEKSNRIYTAVASNPALEVTKDGTPKTNAAGVSKPVTKLIFSVFDLLGTKISRSELELAKPAPKANGGCVVNLIPLPDEEGVVCKVRNGSNGFLWAFNTRGEKIREQAFKPYTYTKMMVQTDYDIYDAWYYSLKDFEQAPYFVKEKSPAYQCVQRLKGKEKDNAYYLSTKDYELFVEWESRSSTIKMKSFDKKKNLDR